MKQFKTHSELDRLGEQEVMELRWEILKKATDFHTKDSNSSQYIRELEYYQHVRFKETEMAVYEKMHKSYLPTFFKGNIEKAYEYSLVNLLNDVGGEFHYINDIQLPESITPTKLKTLQDLFGIK